MFKQTLCLLFIATWPGINPVPAMPRTDKEMFQIVKAEALENRLKGEDGQAMAAYVKALELAKQQFGDHCSYLSDLYLEIGSYAFRLDKFAQAQSYLTEAVKINPYSPQTHVRLAQLLRVRERPGAAAHEALSAIDLEPDLIEARQILALSYLDMNNLPAANKEFYQISAIQHRQVSSGYKHQAQESALSSEQNQRGGRASAGSVLNLRAILFKPQPANQGAVPSPEPTQAANRHNNVLPHRSAKNKINKPLTAGKEKLKTAVIKNKVRQVRKPRSGYNYGKSKILPPPPPIVPIVPGVLYTQPAGFGYGITTGNPSINLKTKAQIKAGAGGKVGNGKTPDTEITSKKVSDNKLQSDGAKKPAANSAGKIMAVPSDADDDFLLEWADSGGKKK